MGLYDKKSLPQLKKICQKHFNEYIRKRDQDEPCISCNKHRKLEAGHYIAVGACDAMRFMEENVHGQCAHCNRFQHGNLLEYREGLIRRYGKEYVEYLEQKKAMFKASYHKFDRFTLITLIEEYKKKKK